MEVNGQCMDVSQAFIKYENFMEYAIELIKSIDMKYGRCCEIANNRLDKLEDRVKMGFGSGPILSRTGNLRDEITNMISKYSSNANSHTLEWGIDQLRGEEKVKFYAHQLGKGKSGQSLPKRAMIGFQPEDSKKILVSLNNWIQRQFASL